MDLKKLITESVILDQFDDINTELISIQESIEKQLMIEGVDDPGILKCIFMAGGPGSGKTYVSMDLLDIFGIDPKTQPFKASFQHRD